jgi:hypothetical protein
MPHQEAEPTPETDLPTYHRAARYQNERPSLKAYTKAQELIRQREDVDLPSYCIIFHKQWHVTVLGEVPPAEIDQRVQSILATGQRTTLPDLVLKTLNHRRLLARDIQPYVEMHHQLGTPIRPDDRS